MHGFNDMNVSLFRQLPITWVYPILSILCAITSVLPESFKWKDKDEKFFRTWIRFSKEKMLLATGIK